MSTAPETKPLTIDNSWVECNSGGVRLLGCVVEPTFQKIDFKGPDGTPHTVERLELGDLFLLFPCYEVQDVVQADNAGRMQAGKQCLPYGLYGHPVPVEVRRPFNLVRVGELHASDREALVACVRMAEKTKLSIRTTRAGILAA